MTTVELWMEVMLSFTLSCAVLVRVWGNGWGGLVWELGRALGDNICPRQIPFSSSDGGRMPFGAARGNGFAIGNVEKSQNSPNFVCDQWSRLWTQFYCGGWDNGDNQNAFLLFHWDTKVTRAGLPAIKVITNQTIAYTFTPEMGRVLFSKSGGWVGGLPFWWGWRGWLGGQVKAVHRVLTPPAGSGLCQLNAIHRELCIIASHWTGISLPVLAMQGK